MPVAPPALPDPATQPGDFLRTLYAIAVARAQPEQILAPHLPAPPKGRTLVIGAGKAACSMAAALEAAWPARAPLSGLVITRYGHLVPGWDDRANPRIEVVEAAHPVPDEAGRAATARMMELTRGLTTDDRVICLISGGGSALLVQPAAGLSLADKQSINQALLRSGANITEMNCVRKHLSEVKGGRLARHCAPAQVVTLLISDVPGDDPAVIASGPTVPDPSTCADALSIIDRYQIAVPQSVRERLRTGELESPKPEDPVFASSQVKLIATPRQSLQAAAQAARSAGVAAYILADDLQGESRDIGAALAALARAVARHGEPFAAPCVLLCGGETTVTVRGAAGSGGRAVETLLAAALELQGHPRIWGLAADTDGIDGTGPHAGATLSPHTLDRLAARGLSARSLLDAHDAARAFEATGELITTGPTQTNVNDFRAFLIL
jgi:glycerate 2-kinase